MFKNLYLSKFSNKNGFLTVAEFKSLNFKIKRVFSITAPKNSVRGRHAHKKCRQIFFCPKGKIEVTLFDGFNTKKITLSKTSKAILIPKRIWVELKFLKDDSFFIALCDQFFQEKDYIRNFREFKKK
tara:strand:- start:7608 stop:7988 length:381 start_codon:yes stop_codon:yes gene_type:complete